MSTTQNELREGSAESVGMSREALERAGATWWIEEMWGETQRSDAASLGAVADRIAAGPSEATSLMRRYGSETQTLRSTAIRSSS